MRCQRPWPVLNEIMTDEEKAAEAVDVIEKFGGQASVAAILGTDRRVVWNWTQRGIPKPWKQVLALRARDYRVKLPKDFMQQGK